MASLLAGYTCVYWSVSPPPRPKLGVRGEGNRDLASSLGYSDLYTSPGNLSRNHLPSRYGLSICHMPGTTVALSIHLVTQVRIDSALREHRLWAETDIKQK